MTTHPLTPYDTGDRLEPHPWIHAGTVAAPTGRQAPCTDDYGRVDFDDENSSAVVSMYLERDDSGGYVLRVENLTDEPIAIAGDIVGLVLTAHHGPGLEELLALAERGRQNFLHQASRGDHTDQEQAAASRRWAAAQNAATAIRYRLPMTTNLETRAAAKH